MRVAYCPAPHHVGDVLYAECCDSVNRGEILRADPPAGCRGGAWDPVKDLALMGNNVKRFMRIWECPKPVLGELRGWAVGGGDRSGAVLRSVVHGERCVHRLCPESHLRHADDDALDLPAWTGTRQAVPAHRPRDRRQDRVPNRTRGARRPARRACRVHRGRRAALPAHPRQSARAQQVADQSSLREHGLRTTQLIGTLFDGITRHTEEAYRWAESFADKGFRERSSESAMRRGRITANDQGIDDTRQSTGHTWFGAGSRHRTHRISSISLRYRHTGCRYPSGASA